MIDLQSSLLQASFDISGLSSGTYHVPIQATYRIQPARLVRIDPQEFTIILDRLVERSFPIQINVSGKPATGYEAQKPKSDLSEGTIRGSETAVNQVESIRAVVNLSAQNETIENDFTLLALDSTGMPVNNIEISPKTIHLQVPIRLLNGYATKVVRVVTTGQVGEKYRLDNILVSPLRVLLFSPDPKVLQVMPGYVETEELDLENTEKDLESRLNLKLPEGVSVVGDQTVRVRVSVAAIESSLARKLPLEIIGLDPQLSAEISVESVDVLLAGPLPVLSTMEEKDVRALLDLTDLEIGVHQVIPRVDIIPDNVRTLSVSPPSVEVKILVQTDTPPKPSTTPTGAESPAPSATPTATATPTRTPTTSLTRTSTPTEAHTLTPAP